MLIAKMLLNKKYIEWKINSGSMYFQIINIVSQLNKWHVYTFALLSHIVWPDTCLNFSDMRFA